MYVRSNSRSSQSLIGILTRCPFSYLIFILLFGSSYIGPNLNVLHFFCTMTVPPVLFRQKFHFKSENYVGSMLFYSHIWLVVSICSQGFGPLLKKSTRLSF